MPVRSSVTPRRAVAVGVAALALCLAGPSAAFAQVVPGLPLPPLPPTAVTNPVTGVITDSLTGQPVLDPATGAPLVDQAVVAAVQAAAAPVAQALPPVAGAPVPTVPKPGTAPPAGGTPTTGTPTAGAPVTSGAKSGTAPAGTAPAGSAPAGAAPAGSAPAGTVANGTAPATATTPARGGFGRTSASTLGFGSLSTYGRGVTGQVALGAPMLASTPGLSLPGMRAPVPAPQTAPVELQAAGSSPVGDVPAGLPLLVVGVAAASVAAAGAGQLAEMRRRRSAARTA